MIRQRKVSRVCVEACVGAVVEAQRTSHMRLKAASAGRLGPDADSLSCVYCHAPPPDPSASSRDASCVVSENVRLVVCALDHASSSEPRASGSPHPRPQGPADRGSPKMSFGAALTPWPPERTATPDARGLGLSVFS